MKKRETTTARQSLRLFWSFAWRYPKNVIAIALCIPSAILLFRFLPPLFVARILERISTDQYVPNNLMQSFGPDLILFLAFTLIGGIVVWRINIYLVWSLEMKVLQDIHHRVFEHLTMQSADFHANRFGGSLVSQANKFAGAYVRIADTIYFQIIGLIVSFVFTFAILAGRAPLVVIFLMLFSVVFMYLAVVITKPVRELNALEAAAATRQTGFLADVVTNIMALKSFANQKLEVARFHKATQATRDATHRLMWASLKRDTIFSSFTTGLGSVALILSLIGVVYFSADVATVFLVVTYTGIITQNLWDFSQSTLRNINRSLGDAQEMTEILELQPSVQDPPHPEPNRMKHGEIEFAGVTFDHENPDGQNILFSDFGLRISRGEKLGLVGHSGSGKTTLTKLLLRFADIHSGEILIDGQNIANVTQESLRDRISYVPQEPLLFHRTIAENIAYGKPGASMAQIKRVAKLAHAHEFIKDLPLGYDTLVGERGVKLSGGQKQRIAIARAMIKDAPILVLDEATSALDSESEMLIQDALWKLMEGRTAIVIAHRLSTIQKMDRIIVMEDGKIVEEGPHKKLIQKDGVYAKLWAHQSGGFIDE